MAQQVLFLGTNANDGTGESLRGAGAKINSMFTEQYALNSQTINAGAVEYNFSGATNGQRITLAVAAGILMGSDAVFIPAFMLPFDITQVPNLAAFHAIGGKLVREGGDFTFFDVQAYGAAGNDIQEDMPAIAAAAAGLVAAGGGVLNFPPGTYLAATATGTYQARVPTVTATFGPADQLFGYQLLFTNVTSVHVKGTGATLHSTLNLANLPVGTSTGATVLCDGVRQFTWDGLNITSITQRNGVGGVIVAGLNGLAFTSQTRDSYSIAVRNAIFTNVYTAIYTFGDTASAFRVRGLTLDSLRHEGGVYTIACHNNGDNVNAQGIQSINTNREYFAYGVSSHNIDMYSDTGVAGFGSIIKAYDRDATDIRYRLLTRKNISAANIDLAVQHAPSAQAIPNRLINIAVDVNNRGTTTGPAVSFSYYRDNTLTATSANNLFAGITLAGIHEQVPVLNVTQDAVGARGSLNTDQLVLLNGTLYQLYNRTGFIDSKQVLNTFVPALRINGSTAGITYGGTTKGEFWRDGQWIETVIRIVLTSKGVSVGGVSLDLPVISGDYSAGNSLVRGMGFVNMVGMASPITGYVQNQGTLAILQHQSATTSVDLANTNLTDTSDMLLHIRYPL